MQAGINYNLENDADILKINSPRHSVEGPYQIVFKDTEKLRYVIVTLKWRGKPSLGMRWFWDKLGFPHSRGNSTWLIIPQQNWKSILDGLEIPHELKNDVSLFLNI